MFGQTQHNMLRQHEERIDALEEQVARLRREVESNRKMSIPRDNPHGIGYMSYDFCYRDTDVKHILGVIIEELGLTWHGGTSGYLGKKNVKVERTKWQVFRVWLTNIRKAFSTKPRGSVVNTNMDWRGRG